MTKRRKEQLDSIIIKASEWANQCVSKSQRRDHFYNSVDYIAMKRNIRLREEDIDYIHQNCPHEFREFDGKI